MATTTSIRDLGTGKFEITDSDGQTRVVGSSIARQRSEEHTSELQSH